MCQIVIYIINHHEDCEKITEHKYNSRFTINHSVYCSTTPPFIQLSRTQITINNTTLYTTTERERERERVRKREGERKKGGAGQVREERRGMEE